MKKKILSGLFALAPLVATGYGVDQSMKSDTRLSDLALNNVEALAQSENPHGDCAVYCTPASGITCIIMWPGAEGITCPEHRRK